MKIATLVVAACSLMASVAVATAAEARPVHHKQCKWVVQHHHKVRHCW